MAEKRHEDVAHSKALHAKPIGTEFRMNRSQTAELLSDAKATLGEGALWNARTRELYWVDILEKKFCIYNPATKQNRVFDCGQYVGTCVPRTSGGVMLALHH